MKKDVISKEILKEIIKDIAKYILKIEINNLEFIDSENQRVESRRADIVALVDKKFILHLEIQSSYEKDMPLRMLRYYTDIKLNSKYPIFQYVVYLGKGNLPNKIEDKLLKYEYNLIDMKKIDCNYFLNQNTPEAIVLAILCDFKGKKPTEIAEHIITKLKTLTDENGFRKYVIMLEELANSQELKEYIKEAEVRLSDVRLEDLPSYEIALIRVIEKGLKNGFDINALSLLTGMKEEEIKKIKEEIKKIKEKLENETKRC